ncbi:MAG: hypothetical protein WCS52_00255 [bacterium]|jgi:hypothetical protein
MKKSLLYFLRTLCVLVVLPAGFVVLYPLVVLLLPEATARLADLPRDLALFVLIESGVVPLFALGLYWRARHRASEKGVREARDTRDVL